MGIVSLSWNAACLEAAREVLRRGSRVDIALPLETHHALYRHVNPDAPPGPHEDIDAEGGEDLLQRIATVAGLEELADLVPALRRHRYRVELSGPDPLLSLLPPEARGRESPAARRAARLERMRKDLKRFIAENVHSRCGEAVTRLEEAGLLERPALPDSETEVREWWLVSPELARNLHDAGEPVLRFCELWMWGRTQGRGPLEDDPELLKASR